MTRYLSEISLSPQALDAFIKNPSNRAEAVRPMFESVGGTLVEYYFGVGQGKVYVIYELPDDTSLAALSMAVLAGGAGTSFKTTAIITAAEAVDVMKQAGEIAYTPPSA